MNTVFKAVGILFLLVVGFIALDWFFTGAGKVSPENVQKQWAFAYEYDESLQAVARQVCSAEKASTAATDPSEATQRRSQVMAYEQNYQRLQGDYNQKLRNAFEAKYVRPSDVPDRAPELDNMKTRVCH